MEEVKSQKLDIRSHRLEFSKIILLMFAALLLVSSGFSQSSGGSVADQAALVTEFDVNGLKVLVKKRPNAPTVSAGLFIRGGARNINAKNSGIENFMLESATEGSQKFPRDVLRRELSSIGSGFGAKVSNDYSVLSLTSTRKHFDRSWDIFADIAMNPAFDKRDVERVRTRILSVLKEEETDNDNFLDVLQSRVIYANHPYFNNVNGTLKTVSEFRLNDLRAYHQKSMKTSRLLLVIVGDIDADKLKRKIAATFGKLPRGKYLEKSYPTLDFSASSLDVTPRASLPTNYIRGIFNAPSLKSPDYYAMRVATTILSSRLFQEVRVRRQLSYAPSASLDSHSTNTANIYVTAVDANQTVKVMFDVIETLKTKPIRPEEIQGMAGQFLTNYYLKQETNWAQVAELAKYELVGGGWRNSFQFLNRLRRVSSQDIQNVAQKYMKNIRFVVIGNQSKIEKSVFLQKAE